MSARGPEAGTAGRPTAPHPGAQPARATLARSTVIGVAWAYGAYIAGRALILVSTAILARLLAPEDFGLVALALVFTGLLEVVSELGLSGALVISREDELDERTETVFVLVVLVSLCFTVLVAATGPLAAAWFGQPELVTMVPVLATTMLLRGLGRTHAALAQRMLNFRVRTGAEVADVILRGATGIGLALAGAGAWSLVIGYLVGSAASTIAYWSLVPWRPRLQPRRRHVRSLLSFGGSLSAVSLIAAVLSVFDYFIIGRVLGTVALGLYTLGFRLPELLVLNFAVVAGEVLFAALAAVDRASLSRAFLESLRYTTMIAAPLATGLVVLADPITHALFGDQWTASIVPMQVLCAYALGVAIELPPGVAYKATGRADVLLKLAVPRTLLTLGSILLFVDEGIVAVAWCQTGVSVLFALVSMVLATRMLGVAPRQVAGAVAPAAIGSAGVACALLAVERAVDGAWPTLLAGVVAGAATYAALLLLVARDALGRLRGHVLVRPGEAT